MMMIKMHAATAALATERAIVVGTFRLPSGPPLVESWTLTQSPALAATALATGERSTAM
jgi:hypothetical protein